MENNANSQNQENQRISIFRTSTDNFSRGLNQNSYAGVETPKFSGDLSVDYTGMTEFIFRANSVIVNFLARVIKESRHFQDLRKELKDYIRRNIERAKEYFELKGKGFNEGGVDLKDFYDAGVKELKDLGNFFFSFRKIF